MPASPCPYLYINNPRATDETKCHCRTKPVGRLPLPLEGLEERDKAEEGRGAPPRGLPTLRPMAMELGASNSSLPTFLFLSAFALFMHIATITNTRWPGYSLPISREGKLIIHSTQLSRVITRWRAYPCGVPSGPIFFFLVFPKSSGTCQKAVLPGRRC